MSARNLDHLLSPRSVALIGASDRPGSLGAAVLARLTTGGFDGALGLVNPKYDSIDGQLCVASVADLADAPDLAVIVTPPSTVPGIIADLGAAGTRAAVVISAGFDADMRQAMLDAAQPHCLRILGPNCIGLQLPGIGLDASFAQLLPQPGNLALLSQSGAIVTAMIDWGAARGIGFSTVASMGDMSDVDVGDLLDHLATDAGTHVILMYLEQVTQARKFMSAARAAARVKPVIAIKAGRSAAAARAASSHTGALAGSDAVYDAAFRRAGILRVDDLVELFDAAEVLARQRPLRSDRLVVVTNGGGAGVLAADAVARHGARLAELSPETIARLDGVLPDNWSRGNPVDIIGDADGLRYRAAIEAVLDDASCDSLLVMNCPTGLAAPGEAAEAVIGALDDRRAAGQHVPPVLAAWLGEATTHDSVARLEAAGLPVYETPGRAVRGFAYLADHGKAQTMLMRTPPTIPGDFSPDRDRVRAEIDRTLADGHKVMSEPSAKAIFAAYGIPTVDTRIAATPEEAEAAAADLSSGAGETAMVVKILSPDITHKSDVGGVRLSLSSPAEVRDAARAILDTLHRHDPQARVDGVVVQPMIRWPDAHELILGLSKDPVFGPVLLFGAGGTSVEVVADRSLALPPLDAVLAGDMIDGTRISRLLAGYRDRPAADRDAMIRALVHLSQLAADFPEITELDINPLLADHRGVIALDARIVVAGTPAVAPGGNPCFAIRPYPSAWEGSTMIGGKSVQIRPIRAEHEALYPGFLAQLSSADIRLRFFGSFSQPSHEQIARFTQIDYDRAMAFVALDPANGALLGVSRLAADPDRTQAEFAVLVRSDLKGQGLGWALMERLIDYARSERICTLFGNVMEGNTTMLKMCRELGFRETSAHEDDGLKRVELRLRPPG